MHNTLHTAVHAPQVHVHACTYNMCAYLYMHARVCMHTLMHNLCTHESPPTALVFT